jgi:flagellar protein FlgJ
LHDLKRQVKNDPKKALPQVAKQFEGIFMQTLLKTMRTGSHFIEESSPFRGKNAELFQEMLDGQYVSKMIDSPNGIGIADMLTKQLGGPTDKAKEILEIRKIATQYTLPKREDAKINLTKSATANEDTHTTTALIEQFVQSIWDKAKQAGAAIGLDPKLLVAQAALETGWGKSIAQGSDGSSSNNLFNIKSASHSDSESVKVQTTEYIADTPVKVSASFRKYASVERSFDDYVSLITQQDRYKNALEHAADPARYVDELGKAGYATDPEYGSKIMSIYHSDDLNQAIKQCGLSGQI